jgi:hypothetical protein
MRELERPDLANSLVDQQIKYWRENRTTYDTLNSRYFSDKLDEHLDEETRKLPSNDSSNLTVQSVLEFLSETSGWNPREEQFLLQLTCDDWIAGIDELNVPDVARAIGAARRLYAYLEQDSKRNVSWDISPLDEALEVIGARSTIGKMRVKVLMSA